MQIEKDAVYGSFRTIKRFKDEGKFGCQCEYCGRKRKFTKAQLLVEPVCDCQVEEVVGSTLEHASSLLDEDTYSLFQEQVQQISEKFENNPDKGVNQFQLMSLKMLVDLIPYAEKEYRRDPRQSNAYAINALVTQIRELISDLQAEDNTLELINKIVLSIVQPVTQKIAGSLIEFNFAVKTQIKGDLKDGHYERVEREIDNATKDLARQIQSHINQMSDEIRESTE